MLTAAQQEAVGVFIARVRSDFAPRVLEVRLLAARPSAKEDSHPDLGLLVLSSLSGEESRATDHALDNLACELALVHDVLIEVEVLHADETRDAQRWTEPASRCLYPA